MQKFKVGDTVQTTRPFRYNNRPIPEGSTGKVVKITENAGGEEISVSIFDIGDKIGFHPGNLEAIDGHAKQHATPTSLSGLDIEEKVSKSRDEFLRNTFT